MPTTRTKSLPCSRVHEESIRGIRDHAARSVLARAYYVSPSNLDSKRDGNWNYMRCGGNCRECGPTGYTPSLQNQVKRDLSAEAL